VQLTDNELVLSFAKHKDFAMFMLKKSYMTTSILKYICDIELFSKWVKSENLCAKNITYNNMLSYIMHIKPNVKQKTIACKINSIRHYYNFLNDIGEMKHNPASEIRIKGIKNKILYDLLSVKELEDIYFSYTNFRKKTALKKSWFKPNSSVTKRNKVILGLMIFQGLGTREIEDLSINDIVLNEGKIIIRGNNRSNQRILRLESFQVIELNEYISSVRKNIFLESGRKINNKVFISKGLGNRISNIATKLLATLTRFNAKIRSFRQIKSSVIASWLKTYNLRHVQYMIGHRYVSSTETYLHSHTDTLYSDVNRFHPII